MMDAVELTVLEALLIERAYRNAGDKNRAIRTLLTRANKVLWEAGKAAADHICDGLCTTCWGDGWRHVAPAVLNGPCEDCSGTGRRTAAQVAAQAARAAVLPRAPEEDRGG